MREAADTSSAGLTSAEAGTRLARDGPNRLPPPRRRPGFLRFTDQLVHFFAVMLWVAGGLALLAGLPQLGIAIFVVILLNAVFSFVQESRADHAAERLRSLLPRQVTVRRDGRRTLIDADEVVVDDVVLLEAGDRIPADAIAVELSNLLVDTSLLTGESVPSTIEREDRLFAGTFVLEGDARAVVTATGTSTRLADIARLTTQTPKPVTPLSKELHRVVRTIAIIALGVGAAFFVISLLVGNDASEGFVFAIGVTVALVPEALLPTVTLSLAWGAEQMAKRNVLVRELEAVETLGSTTFICTDKTGTLTRNEMAVVEAWTPSGMALIDGVGYQPEATIVFSSPDIQGEMEALGLAAARCSTGYAYEGDGVWRPHGDPMEAALDAFAQRLGLGTEADRDGLVVKARFPFDPRRRRMSVVTERDVIVKGAPDAVLPLCVDGAAAESVLEALTSKGLRVLAVAGRSRGRRRRPGDRERGGGRAPPLRADRARGSTEARCPGGHRDLPAGRHQGRDGDGRPPGDRGGDRDGGGSANGR